MDVIDELLDDDAFDPKKLFDENEYSTLIINREGFSKKQNAAADLVETLLDKKTTRQESEEIFLGLKEANAQQMLINSITSAEKPEEKAILAAACWESGLDFSNYYLFFVELACSDDFKLAMEALTVAEQSEEQLPEKTIADALSLAKNTKSKNTLLINDLILSIESRLA